MSRDRTGSLSYESDGLYGRVTWVDANGKRRQKKRKASTTREARRLIREMLDEIEEHGDKQTLDRANLTFTQLADHYEENFAIPAKYDQHGNKKAGLRSYRDARRKLALLRHHFSGRISHITYGEIEDFKRLRLNAPVTITKRAGSRREKVYRQEFRPRTIASVHRELALLRRLFTIAVQKNWLNRNPFRDGDSLITVAEEKPRERIATREESTVLLGACVDQRDHLRPFLILAFDTGFRAGEMYNLKVSDVNFEDNCITAVSYKGKRRRERQFDMTPRLADEMRKLCEGKKAGNLLFGFQSVKRSFATAKRIAALSDFRLHDTRHTATTRLISRGLSLSEAGKLMGHTQPSTTWRYMHADKKTRKRAAELLAEDEE